MDLNSFPPITTLWVSGALALGLLENFNVLAAHHLFYSPHHVFVKGEYWRFITAFMYFGPLNMSFIYNLFFNVRYAYMLESQTYGSTRRAQYAWMLLLTAVSILLLSPWLSIRFFADTMAWVLMNIWSRKMRHLQLNLFGLGIINAANLPLWELGIRLFTGSMNIQDRLTGYGLAHLCTFDHLFRLLFDGAMAERIRRPGLLSLRSTTTLVRVHAYFRLDLFGQHAPS